MHVEELTFYFYFFPFNCNFDFLLAMTNNEMKCSIIYEKIVMQAGDDEQMINYEWPLTNSQNTLAPNSMHKLMQ